MKTRIYFTPEQDIWLRERFYTAGTFDVLTESFNQEFGVSRTLEAIRQRCRKNLKLDTTVLNTKHHYAPEHDEWLRENYSKFDSYDDLTISFNRIFNTHRGKTSVAEHCTKRLKLGGMPNPTTYGKKPKEQLPIGTIRKSQTAIYIKVQDLPTDGTVHISGYAEPYWLPLQKKIYQDRYGEIQPDQMICFLDGNSDNFELDNLYPITRQISAVMSKNKWWTNSKQHTLTAIKWCELYYVLKNVKENSL